MADPTIQTFCCHNTNKTDLSMIIMNRFDSNAYNSISIASSTLGILGAIYQIIPREEFSATHKWISFSAERNRKIITYLAVADLFASLGVLLRASIWISHKNIMPATYDNASVLFCALSSAWIQYFYTASWIWTLCYAIDIRLILGERKNHFKKYHFFAWIIPAFLTAGGLSLLYLPHANCHTSKKLSSVIFRILPNYIATYILIAIVMIANPCLYMCSTKDLEKIIVCNSGQVTNRERDMMDAIKLKFSLINIAFYVCWFPNLVNGVLIWTLWYDLPSEIIVHTWYIMALTNPLQALFNCLVYRRWTGSEKIIVPWKSDSVETERNLVGSHSSRYSQQQSLQEENLPLLHSFRKSLSNGYTHRR